MGVAIRAIAPCARYFLELQGPDVRPLHPRAQLEVPADGPESEQAHAVLAGNHLPCPFLWSELPLARVPDVRRQVAQRLLAGQLGDDALAVVVDGEHRDPAMAPAGEPDAGRSGVQRVLDQLGHGLARVALAPGEPADQIEGICRTESDRVAPAGGHAPGAYRHQATLPGDHIGGYTLV